MFINTDDEGRGRIQRLCDIALKANGMAELQNTVDILNCIAAKQPPALAPGLGATGLSTKPQGQKTTGIAADQQLKSVGEEKAIEVN